MDIDFRKIVNCYQIYNMMNNFSRMVVVEVRLTRVEGVMKVEEYRVYKWIIQEIMLLKMKTK